MGKIKKYIVTLLGISIMIIPFGHVYCHNTKKDKDLLAQELSLTTIEGEKISVSEYKGKKPVMLVFLTTWCGYCKREMPNINKVYENFKEIEVVGIDPGWNDSIKRLKSFIKRYKIRFKVAFDSSGEWGKFYHIRGVPTIIIIDINGDIQYIGNNVPKDLKEKIKTFMLKKEKK